MSKQPIADIVLQHSQGGSTVALRNVTPAEVMVLVAMHHKNCGKDPIVKLIEHAANREETAISEMATKKAEWQKKRVTDESEANITEEVREKRIQSADAHLNRLQGQIEEWQAVQAIRYLTQDEEKRRLATRYSSIFLESFYPGSIPQLPSTFAQARSAGTSAKAPSESWLVGAERMAGAA